MCSLVNEALFQTRSRFKVIYDHCYCFTLRKKDGEKKIEVEKEGKKIQWQLNLRLCEQTQDVVSVIKLMNASVF